MFKMMLVCPDAFDPLKMEGLTIKNDSKLIKIQNYKVTKIAKLQKLCLC